MHVSADSCNVAIVIVAVYSQAVVFAKMCKIIKNNFHLLSVIGSNKSGKVLKVLLKESGENLTKALTELYHNLLVEDGAVVLTNKEKKFVTQHKSLIEQLANKTVKTSAKNRILGNKGPAFCQQTINPVLKSFEFSFVSKKE